MSTQQKDSDLYLSLVYAQNDFGACCFSQSRTRTKRYLESFQEDNISIGIAICEKGKVSRQWIIEISSSMNLPCTNVLPASEYFTAIIHQ